ncbi:MAG: hypothetical protein Q9159_007161 [Coniocarpon cinnabarinum]
MGSSASKQDASQHTFSASTPVSFSQGLTDSLQSSAQTDSTRARDLELHIQSRVASELEKLRGQAIQKLAAASEKVSQEPFTPPVKPAAGEAPKAGLIEKPLFNRIGDWLSGQSASKVPARPDLDTPTLQREIGALKQRLAERKQVRELDAGVSQARSSVVQCLQDNDSRPLDCWQEVESFKEEVRRLEKRFMDESGR